MGEKRDVIQEVKAALAAHDKAGRSAEDYVALSYMTTHGWDWLRALVAEVERLREEVDVWHAQYERLGEKWEKADAALAALREQRCETCEYARDKAPMVCLRQAPSFLCSAVNFGCRAWARREP